MVEGLWSIEFTSTGGGAWRTGWGVVVLQGGQVLGGDPCFAIVGTYTKSLIGAQMEATVAVRRFRDDKNYESILGRGMDNYRLKLFGTAAPSEFTLRGSVIDGASETIKVTLRRQY